MDMASVIGLDDTDSREAGMCTTYLASVVADALVADGYRVDDRFLVRLNPAVPHKTRGNAALALRTDAPPARAFETARTRVRELAVADDPKTNPGVAVVSADRADRLASLTWSAIRDIVAPSVAVDRLRDADAHTWTAGDGRGLVGAAAAIGSPVALDEWTVELIGYRPPSRYGTERRVDTASAFEAARTTHPLTWDTVDHEAGSVVCTPRTPGPVLFGVRGETPAAVERAAAILEHEPLERRGLFTTNQGTDMHLRPGTPGSVHEGRSYRLRGRVVGPVETRRGGHVHFTLRGGDGALGCVAFEPTKGFRRHVRQLIPGDRVTACGEIGRGTLKLEKFALHRPRRYRRVVPRCRSCAVAMESAGAGQGYRCPRCDRSADGRTVEAVDRALDPGWYEVPPSARRHLARPLVRGVRPASTDGSR